MLRAGNEAEAEKFFLRRCACLENKALSKGWFSRGTSCSDFEGQLLSWGYSCVCSPGAAITIQVNYCAIVAWIGRADVPAFLARKSRRTHRRSSTRRSSNRNRPKSFFFFQLSVSNFPSFDRRISQMHSMSVIAVAKGRGEGGL